MGTVVEFALDSGAITPEEHASFAGRSDKAARELVAAQRTYQLDADPARRFVASLQHVLTAGCAHIADRENKAPETPLQLGWRRSGPGLIPCGARIGWISRDDVYLDSRCACEVAREVVHPDCFEMTEQTMRRLHKRGLLASIDIRRNTLLVLRQVGNSARRVLHLKTKDLISA